VSSLLAAGTGGYVLKQSPSDARCAFRCPPAVDTAIRHSRELKVSARAEIRPSADECNKVSVLSDTESGASTVAGSHTAIMKSRSSCRSPRKLPARSRVTRCGKQDSRHACTSSSTFVHADATGTSARPISSPCFRVCSPESLNNYGPARTRPVGSTVSGSHAPDRWTP
jgi:hypothetical protein